MQIKLEKVAGQGPVEFAARMYRYGFRALDATKRGEATLVIPANNAIDVAIAYQAAREGNTADLEWSLAVQAAIATQAQKLLDEIAELAEVDSKIWDLAMKLPYSEFLDANGEEGVRALTALHKLKLGELPKTEEGK